MAANPLKQLLDQGQSFWMDTISRRMIQDGTLKRMIREDGLRGVTSNPDIFQKAIADSDLYDEQIRELALKGLSAAEIYEALAVSDIQAAADVLRPVYDKSAGLDGYISLEVSPYLAFDTEGTLDEARRLWAAVARPNVYIKVPATPPGIPVIRELIAEGINVNVTLIFSLEAYNDVMEAYIDGLEARARARRPLDHVSSVASFFVSRIDVLVDRLLANRVTAYTDHPAVPSLADATRPPVAAGGASAGEELAPQHLFGKAAIAAAKVAYQNFKEKFSGRRWEALAKKGARVQRPLWASTSTKNPLYPDTVYVEPLIGPNTVNTMPMVTIDAWRDHGAVRGNTLEEGVDEARATLDALKEFGIDLTSATWQIMEEGVNKFNVPFDKLLSSIAQKRRTLLGWGPESQTESVATSGKQLAAVLESMSEAQFLPRLYRRDPSLFASDRSLFPVVRNRLGWVDAPRMFLEAADDLMAFAEEVKRSGIRHVVLLGMGGSSLCPEVCARTFGSRKGFPELVVLDTTSPDAIAACEEKIDLRRSLFVPASKSGGTIETNSLYKYFFHRLEEAGVREPGAHFIAITDPGTSLQALAAEYGFRRTFINPPDIGGRFSALSFFGLVPMALLGLNVRVLLERAVAFSRDAHSLVPAAADPSVRLGATLAVLAQAGRDKLTLVISPRLASLGAWIEQLVAESTGKHGVGILPVDGEPLGPASLYGQDRVFVSIELQGDKVETARLAALEKAGHPVIRIRVPDALDLGVEFLRWEIATAVAGALLRINPFDEPNVAESKANSNAAIEEFRKRGTLPLPKADVSKSEGVTASLTKAGRKTLKSAPQEEDELSRAVRALVASAREGEYIALLAYLPYGGPASARLASLRKGLRDTTGRATTLGFGPRYLHSTGQLHKGGPDNGVFIMFTADPKTELPIPGQDYSFATLIRAQALGDFRSLDAHGRRAILVHLGANPEAALKRLSAAITGASTGV